MFTKIYNIVYIYVSFLQLCSLESSRTFWAVALSEVFLWFTLVVLINVTIPVNIHAEKTRNLSRT